MNAVKAAVCLLLPVLAMASADVYAQSDAPGTKLRRVVPRDTETMVASAAQWRTHEGEAQRQCILNGIPALELVTPLNTAPSVLSMPTSASRKGQGA
jgi:hypothetical protein